MIHGGADTYIKPEMARALFGYAGRPKELWLVEGAKHNQALHTAGDEYRRRVLEFFDNHLAQKADSPQSHKGNKEENEERTEAARPAPAFRR